MINLANKNVGKSPPSPIAEARVHKHVKQIKYPTPFTSFSFFFFAYP